MNKQRAAAGGLASTAAAAATLLASLTVPVGAHAAGAGEARTVIPVNIGLPVSNYWPAYVARELGLFDQVGLEPEFYMFNTGAPLIAGVRSGSLDVAWTGLATLFMVGQGIPLTYLYTPLNSSSQMGMVVKPGVGIESFHDLHRASAVGAPTATCAHISTVLAAKKAGIPIDSINRSNLSPELLRTALDQGQIDAAFIWGPWNLQLAAAGYEIVNWDRDYDGEVCATNVTARPAFLEAHPEVGCRLVEVQALTLEAVRDNPDLAIESLQKVLGLSREIAQLTYETLEIPSLESQLNPDAPWSLTATDGGLAGKLHLAGQALYEAKVFEQPVSRETIRAAIDPRYVEEFLTTGCR